MHTTTATPMTTTARINLLLNRVERQLTLTPPEKIAVDKLRKHLAKVAKEHLDKVAKEHEAARIEKQEEEERDQVERENFRSAEADAEANLGKD